MAFKVNTQGVFLPLLDAINQTKLGGNSTVEISYSFGTSIKQIRKDGGQVSSSLSALDFIKEAEKALSLWEFLFKTIYSKNSKNKSALSLTFKEVDTGGDLVIKLKALKNNIPFNITNGNIELNSTLDWARVDAVKGVKVFNHLGYSIGRVLGLPEDSSHSILNSKMLNLDLVLTFNLGLNFEGGISDFSPLYTKELTETVQASYGSSSTSLPAVYGCTDASASNYNSNATIDDGSCNSIPVSSSRLLLSSSTYEFISDLNLLAALRDVGTISTSIIDPAFPISITPDVTCIFKNAAGDNALYAIMENSGNVEIFNVFGDKVSNNPATGYSINPLLDEDLLEGNPSVFKFNDYIAFVSFGVQIHEIDTNAHQIVDGNPAVNCDTNSPLGNYVSYHWSLPPRFKGDLHLTVGFESYSDFLADKDLSNGATEVAATGVTIYSSPIESRKLATFKSFNQTMEYIDFLVSFDIYSSNFIATYGKVEVEEYYRINNGIPNGDGTYDYRYALGADDTGILGAPDSGVIISTFEGFSFDTETYGIYSISGRKWNSSTSMFDLPSVEPTVNHSSPSDHEYLISQLPVVIGDKLFEDIGDIKAEQIGKGGFYANSTYSSIAAQPSIVEELERSVGYYIVAYAVKHGIILMRMYSHSPILLRPDDGGVELHVCGGDPNNSAVELAGGFTPISMAFSFYNNYLYTIVRDPDTMDKYICIYNLTSNDGSTISNEAKMVADPLNGGASRVVTVGNSVYILSKDSSEYIKIPNADTFQSVLSFSVDPEAFITNTSSALAYLPTDTESRISKTDEVTIETGEFSLLNNYEVSSFIATPRGTLNLGDPTSVNLTGGDGEWLASTTATDSGGNLLLTAAITSPTTVVVWDREGNVLVEQTIEGIQYGSNSCLLVYPFEGTSYGVSVLVTPLEGVAWFQNRISLTSIVSFEEGRDLSITSPTNLSLGTATEFIASTVATATGAEILPLSGSNTFIPGISLYSNVPLNQTALYLYLIPGYSNVKLAVKDETPNISPVADFGADLDVENSCFAIYSDASKIAIGMHNDTNFEIQIIDVSAKPATVTHTMSAEAVLQLNSLAANSNYNIAQMEFSQSGDWLYLLLRDKELNVVNNPSKLVKINLQYSTILSEHVTELEDFFYDENFIGQTVPDYFTSDSDGNLDYTNNDIKEKSHLSGMFKGSNGIIYTLFVNDGTVVPTLGKILNQNNDSAEHPAKHAPASIRLSDTPMNLGSYGAFIDMSNEGVTLSKGPDDPITSFVIEGCTDWNACNYNAAANYEDGSCQYPASEVCDCDEPLLYEHCGCTAEYEYTNIGGVNYEPCEYCNDPAALNYSEPPSTGSMPQVNNNMCIYNVCAYEVELSQSGNIPCNGMTVAQLNASGQNWEHDSSMCYFPFEGCECEAGTLVNTTDSNNYPTHCIVCSTYAVPGATPPTNPAEADPVCGCGDTPIIDGYCDCDTPESAYCDCDGNPNPGYCNGCSGDLESLYCGCGTDLLEQYQSGIGESGICDCDGTPKLLYYADVEGDGLGDPNTAAWYCVGEQPDGWVSNNLDTNIDCIEDSSFTGYQNHLTGEFISGDVDAAGQCSGPAVIDSCGNISLSGNPDGTNIDGCCPGYVADCLTGECVLPADATQNDAAAGGCACGYLFREGCGCVPADQIDVIFDCDNCTNIPDGECDCYGHVEDACGECNGDNSTCTGCMDPIAENYDATALVEGPCSYLTLGEVIEDVVTASSSNTVVTPLNLQAPYALFASQASIDFSSISAGYTIQEIDGIEYYIDEARITEKCQVISETNMTLVCSNPLENAEVSYSIEGTSTVTGVISNPSSYNTINVPPGTAASAYIPVYYFRVTDEVMASLEVNTFEEIFGSLYDKIHMIKTPSSEVILPGSNFDGIGVLESGENFTVSNSSEGVPTSLPQYHIYAIVPNYNDAAGSYYEFELDFSNFLPTTLPCGGESPTPICCESSGVQNPGAFTVNDEGELVPDNECEVCDSVCIPEEVTTMEVCCDPLALNSVQEYNGEIHICNNTLCSYAAPEMDGLRVKLTIHTQGLNSLEDLKWVLYSRSGSIINQSSPIALGEAVDGVIVKTIQLSSYSDCMWFLPIGFEYKDIWKSVRLEILNSTYTTSEGVGNEVLHSLLYGSSPTKGGSVKIDLGSSPCLLGCNESTLQTEYCEKHIKEDFAEFTDIVLHVQTAGDEEGSFTDTTVEVINVTTGDTLGYLEALSPSTEYVQTFRITSDTNIGIKVINPNSGTLVYKLLSEFGELITIKEV
jgi:hypothetical protein